MKRATVFLILLLMAAAGAWFYFKQPAKRSEYGTPAAFTPIPADLAGQFSGERARAAVEELVALGPRPPESEGYEKALKYLEEQFSGMGWITLRQTFTRATPKGPVAFTNLLARHGSAPGDWGNSPPVVIGGHLDSKEMSFPFVGANDGGSSTGVILELARVLSGDPASAAKVEFVLFDGEEAILANITSSDGLYGSKYYAREMSKRPALPKLGIVLDLVGDSDHEFHFNPEAPPAFATAVEQAAKASGLPIRRAPGPIIDDHVPLQHAGLPCLHLIGDFANMSYWHQKGDTMEVIDADALEKTGRTTLRFLATVRPD